MGINGFFDGFQAVGDFVQGLFNQVSNFFESVDIQPLINWMPLDLRAACTGLFYLFVAISLFSIVKHLIVNW